MARTCTRVCARLPQRSGLRTKCASNRVPNVCRVTQILFEFVPSVVSVVPVTIPMMLMANTLCFVIFFQFPELNMRFTVWLDRK